MLARKPLAGTVAANVLAHGTGGLNIDGTRIGTEGGTAGAGAGAGAVVFADGLNGTFGQVVPGLGRWPANVILGCACEGPGHALDCPVSLLDAQSGEAGGGFGVRGDSDGLEYGYGATGEVVGHGEFGGASRFFYTAKASRAEREAGLSALLPVRRSDGRETDIENPRLRTNERRNHHPTVKPVDLMRWLVRLVTPPNGLVLDPFLGSGSTGMAALDEGMRFVGFDLDAEYVRIARERISHRHLLAPAQPTEADGQGVLL